MHIPVALLDVHLMYEQSMQKCSDIHCLQLSCTYDALQVEVHIYYIIKCANDARAYKLHYCMYIYVPSLYMHMMQNFIEYHDVFLMHVQPDAHSSFISMRLMSNILAYVVVYLMCIGSTAL